MKLFLSTAGRFFVIGMVFLVTLEGGARLIIASGSLPGLIHPDASLFLQGASREATHPYLSLLAFPKAAPFKEQALRMAPPPESDRILFNEALRPKERSKEFIVALSGNSVMEAIQMKDSSRERLRQAIQQAVPQAKGKRVLFLELAQYAFKQPQQTIASLLFLDYYDAMINLDGFNDVGHPMSLGLPSHYPLLYPRLALSTEGPGFYFWLGARELYTNLLQRIRPESLQRIASVHLTFLAYRSLLSYFQPQEMLLGVPKDQALLGDPLPFVRLWENNVRSQAAFLRAAGKPAWFFVQPDIHDPGSKPLTAREEGFRQSNPQIGEKVEHNYPLLKQAAKRLRQEGLPLWDLTGIYRGNRAELYIDGCCHVNELGQELLVEAMARAIAPGLAPSR